MKKTVQSDHQQAKNAVAGPARSPRPQEACAQGYLAQLSATMNNGPQAQALAQRKEGFMQSPRLQDLAGLAARINQDANASPSQNAGLKPGAGGMEAKISRADNGNSVPEAFEETGGSHHSFTGQKTTQRKEVATEVKGLTHLVKKKGNTILGSTEEHEVEEPEQVIVETNDRIRSRRGPNQEEFAGYDKVSPRMYRWYGIREAPGLGKAPNWYIREDAFDLKEDDQPRVSKNLEAVRGRRTRQSHHLMRFEVWCNSDTKLDPTGHMMVYEVRSGVYREYAQQRTGAEITDPPKEKTDDLELTKRLDESFVKRLKDYKGPKPKPYVLDALELNPEEALDRRKKETRGKETKVPRYNRVLWADVMITVEHSIIFGEKSQSRRRGFYYFLKEVQADVEGATRCLSWLEDVAEIQGISLITGHAADVLNNYIQQAGIQEYHTGEKNFKDFSEL
jgi:hypothetical protein